MKKSGGKGRQGPKSKTRHLPSETSSTTNENPPSKKARIEKDAPAAEPQKIAEEDDEVMEVDVTPRSRLTPMLRVWVPEKDRTRVNIREYFRDAKGQMIPGHRGMSLTLNEYHTFVKAMRIINQQILDITPKNLKI